MHRLGHRDVNHSLGLVISSIGGQGVRIGGLKLGEIFQPLLGAPRILNLGRCALAVQPETREDRKQQQNQHGSKKKDAPAGMSFVPSRMADSRSIVIVAHQSV